MVAQAHFMLRQQRPAVFKVRAYKQDIFGNVAARSRLGEADLTSIHAHHECGAESFGEGHRRSTGTAAAIQDEGIAAIVQACQNLRSEMRRMPRRGTLKRMLQVVIDDSFQARVNPPLIRSNRTRRGIQSNFTCALSNTGPSTHTRFMAVPAGEIGRAHV